MLHSSSKDASPRPEQELTSSWPLLPEIIAPRREPQRASISSTIARVRHEPELFHRRPPGL